MFYKFYDPFINECLVDFVLKPLEMQCSWLMLCGCLLLQVLLGAEADVDHADVDGWTALRAAAWGGHTQVWGYKQVTTIYSAP